MVHIECVPNRAQGVRQWRRQPTKHRLHQLPSRFTYHCLLLHIRLRFGEKLELWNVTPMVLKNVTEAFSSLLNYAMQMACILMSRAQCEVTDECMAESLQLKHHRICASL